MGTIVYAYSVTIPTGTTVSSPYEYALSLPIGIVEHIDVDVPMGANDVVGWQLWHGGGQAFPQVIDTWFYGNSITKTLYPVESLDAGSWYFVGFNSGMYTHTIRISIYWQSTVNKQQVIGTSSSVAISPAA